MPAQLRCRPHVGVRRSRSCAWMNAWARPARPQALRHAHLRPTFPRPPRRVGTCGRRPRRTPRRRAGGPPSRRAIARRQPAAHACRRADRGDLRVELAEDGGNRGPAGSSAPTGTSRRTRPA
jgi:hypothetical protein